MKKKTNSGLKIISINRKASFNFFFEKLYEAGFVLKGSETYCKPNSYDEQFNKYLSLCNICEPSLKRFYIVMSVFRDQDTISKEKLQTDCDLIAKELERKEGWPYPEFSDKTKFRNFIELLITERYVNEDDELLAASSIAIKARNSCEVFFDNRFLDLIENIN